MLTYTKEAALNQLKLLISEVEHLKNQQRRSAAHTRWIANCVMLLLEVFGQDSLYFQAFGMFTWSFEGSIPVLYHPRSGYSPQDIIDQLQQTAYLKQLDSAMGYLQAALDRLEQAENIGAVYQGKDTTPESSLILKIINLAEKLRKAIHGEPKDEKEVQVIFENLLIGAGIPYSRETESIEYSTKTYTPDFTVSKISLAIEIKICNRVGREKDIIAEINDDILAYGTKFENLIFVIYDISFIRDVEVFTAAFEANQNVFVRVVKH